MESYKCIIQGKVQGVYYRKNICENAQKENFKGYVRNLPNKDVEVCVSCEPQDLERFIAILKQGSPNSIVENIATYPHTELFSEPFYIKYD